MTDALTPTPSRIEQLEGVVGKLTGRFNILRKYGPLNDQQLAVIEAQEAREARVAAKHAKTPGLVAAEAARIEQRKRDITAELINDGSLALFLDKQRVHLDGRTTPACPHCGQPLLEVNGRIYTAASQVFECGGDLFQAACQPIDTIIACPACRSGVQVLIQIRPR